MSEETNESEGTTNKKAWIVELVGSNPHVLEQKLNELHASGYQIKDVTTDYIDEHGISCFLIVAFDPMELMMAQRKSIMEATEKLRTEMSAGLGGLAGLDLGSLRKP